MLRTLLTSAALVALAACATETPYGPAPQDGRYGYAESRIEADRYRVSFSGNSLTDLETVENYLLYRAAELTLQQGGDWFKVVNRDTDSKTRIVGDSLYGPRYAGFYYNYYHPRYGWYPWYDPFWRNDIYLREISRYDAYAEIVVGKGAKPAGDAAAYDAREVQANLAGKIRYPAK